MNLDLLVGVGALFFLLGLGFFFFAFRRLSRAKKARSWPSVQGRMLAAGLRSWDSTDSDDRTTTYYAPQLRYEYEVGGTGYEGKELRVSGSQTTSRKEADALIASYPVGAAVPVYYDPARPRDAVLERKAGAGTWILFFIGAIFVVLGAATSLGFMR